MDKVRVLRIVEYVGPREWVEKIVDESINGTKDLGTYKGQSCAIRAATIGSYPEILEGEIKTK
jgi:hypothetical protein